MTGDWPPQRQNRLPGRIKSAIPARCSGSSLPEWADPVAGWRLRGPFRARSEGNREPEPQTAKTRRSGGSSHRRSEVKRDRSGSWQNRASLTSHRISSADFAPQAESALMRRFPRRVLLSTRGKHCRSQSNWTNPAPLAGARAGRASTTATAASAIPSAAGSTATWSPASCSLRSVGSPHARQRPAWGSAEG